MLPVPHAEIGPNLSKRIAPRHNDEQCLARPTPASQAKNAVRVSHFFPPNVGSIQSPSLTRIAPHVGHQSSALVRKRPFGVLYASSPCSGFVNSTYSVCAHTTSSPYSQSKSFRQSQTPLVRYGNLPRLGSHLELRHTSGNASDGPVRTFE